MVWKEKQVMEGEAMDVNARTRIFVLKKKGRRFEMCQGELLVKSVAVI